MWRGQVASAIRGKRGQKFLADLLAALDALPVKELIVGDLEKLDGSVCAIGALGKVRGVDMLKLDPDNYDQVADAFGIAHQLAQEVVFLNDEHWQPETPSQRFQRMRAWVVSQIKDVSR